MTAVEQATPKKKAPKKAGAAEPALHVVEPPKPKPKPGDKDYDWAAEYPGEKCYVYTVPEGTDSPAGLTVGLTVLGPKRRPKPGILRRLHRENKAGPDMNLMWYFLELVCSPNSLAVQEELDPDEYNDMVRGWAEFAGIELSE